MRLSEAQINNFKQSLFSIDKDAVLYLFGSRADDNKKGGDIDLAILSDKIFFKEECAILNNYYDKFEEEKIDLLVVKPPYDLTFWQLIKTDAIKL